MIFRREKKAAGQTLIETLAALFILVMGISAAVGLAVYAFSSSTNINKEIIATGLAREGIEAVRNMRDTNWLKDTLGTPALGTNCYIFNNSTGTSSCYPNWIGGGTVPYCLDPTKNNGSNCNGLNANTAAYYLGFDFSSGPYLWTLVKDTGAGNFGLKFDGSFPGDLTTTGFYSPGAGIACSNAPGTSDFCRKIVITKDSTDPPYNTDPKFVLLKVQSQVWWVDKKCPRSLDWPGPSACSVELDTYLTNWKNYSVIGNP